MSLTKAFTGHAVRENSGLAAEIGCALEVSGLFGVSNVPQRQDSVEKVRF
jgi:hypothetical protein